MTLPNLSSQRHPVAARSLASEAASSSLLVAHQAAGLLASAQELDALVLFGSVARGDATPSSDIDLLAVGDEQLDPTRLRRLFHRAPWADLVTLACRSQREFHDLMSSGDSFAAHLHSESVVLLDRSNRVSEVLRSPFVPRPVEHEMKAHLRRLQPLEDLRQFGDYYVFCFARLYSIGKSVVIARLHQHGQPEFDRRRAFASLMIQRPELSSDISLLVGLSPYYDAVSRDSSTPIPDSCEGPDARDRAAEAIVAIKRIARVA